MSIQLKFFGDESGIHDTAKWCVVCGYIGSSEQWDSFNEEWRRTLSKHGLDYFHATEFFAAHGGDGLEVLAEFTAIINKYDIVPVGTAVEIAPFLSFSYGERMFLTGAVRNVDARRWSTTGLPSRSYLAACMGYLLKR